MATEKRQTPKQPIEAEEKQTTENTLELLDDEFVFPSGNETINGKKYVARILNLEDIRELQNKFPQWNSDDFTEILGMEEGEESTREASVLRVEFMQEILMMAVSEQNNLDKRGVMRLFNMKRTPLMTEVLQKILGYIEPDTSAKNGQPDASASNTSKPTGAISSASSPSTTTLPSPKSKS